MLAILHKDYKKKNKKKHTHKHDFITMDTPSPT